MVEEENAKNGSEKKVRKRRGKPRSAKMKREKSARYGATTKDPESKPVAVVAAADPKSGKRKRTAASSAEDAKEPAELFQHRVFIQKLALTMTEKRIRKYLGGCGEILNVKLVKNTRLIFKGSAFVSFADEDAVTAALALDGCDLEEQTLVIKRAAAPLEEPCLRVFVGGLPYDADQKTLRKDFAECGEIEAFRMLKHAESGDFKGMFFVTYKSPAGVKAALKFHDTEYSGRQITVRLANKKRKGD